MNCGRCGKKVGRAAKRCPHCGRAMPAKSGTFQTSTVRISLGNEDLVYRTVEEVPPPLRTRLIESTNGGNSATILIADRRGRTELARALRRLPGPGRARVRRGLLHPAAGPAWLTPRRRQGILAFLILMCLALIAAAFLHR